MADGWTIISCLAREARAVFWLGTRMARMSGYAVNGLGERINGDMFNPFIHGSHTCREATVIRTQVQLTAEQSPALKEFRSRSKIASQFVPPLAQRKYEVVFEQVLSIMVRKG